VKQSRSPGGKHVEGYCFKHMDDPCCNCSLGQANPQCSTGCLIVNRDANGNSLNPSHSRVHQFASTANSAPTTTALHSLGMDTSVKGSSQSKHLPLIIGAAVGGALVLILLSLGVFLCIRKRRKPRKAPSAEVRGMIFRSGRVSPSVQFLENGGGLLRRMHTAGSTPGLSPSVSVYGGPVIEVPMGAEVLNDAPPAFTQGNFRDPVVEKVARAHQTVAAYHQRSESRAAAGRDSNTPQMGYGVGTSPRVGIGFPNR
jgi:hypothetical protein